MITEIAAMASSLRAAGDIVSSMIGLRDAEAVRSKVIELQGVILAAQNSAISAQSDQFALTQKVADLEKKVAELEAWSARKARYKLHAWPTGDFTYRLKDGVQPAEPIHHICAACFSKESIYVCNRHDDVYYDRLQCPQCKTSIKMAPNGVADRLNEEARRQNEAYQRNLYDLY